MNLNEISTNSRYHFVFGQLSNIMRAYNRFENVYLSIM